MQANMLLVHDALLRRLEVVRQGLRQLRLHEVHHLTEPLILLLKFSDAFFEMICVWWRRS